jgi:NTP pyrophosphatase (non-canonical NTP hydrolase)
MGLRKEIIEWCAKEWPYRDKTSIRVKLLEEIQELKEAIENEDVINTAEELFDVFAMVVDYAHRHDVNLKRMFAAKRAIVDRRKISGVKDKQLEREILKGYL